jgi:glutathione S-transferase
MMVDARSCPVSFPIEIDAKTGRAHQLLELLVNANQNLRICTHAFGVEGSFMKLYQFFASPFPTRVRLMLYAKGIPFEIVEPPGFGNSNLPKGDYLKLNPLGRVPTLVLDDGRALPESEVICEYLEETFPTPPLLPVDPWQRAQVRLVTRISDIYLVMAMVPLFDTLATRRSEWDRVLIDAAVDKVAEALAALEFYIGINGYAVGPSLTVADGALAPMLILAEEWAPSVFGTDPPLHRFPKLSAYWHDVQADPVVSRVVRETRDAIAQSRAQRLQAKGQ